MNVTSSLVAGLDEAGRGPLAGPVVAAAVVLNPSRPIVGLADSKKLSEKKREALWDPIFSCAHAIGIGVVSPGDIDRLNILQASLLAMKLAFDQIPILVQQAWVDGNQKAPLGSQVIQKTFVGGDSVHECIMAASIVAKVHRDRLMLAYAEQYPGYGFEKHKGYPTVSHRQALKELGPCAIHRLSFGALSPLV